MAVLVSDSFNRTDSATTLGSTDSYAGGTAKTWAVKSGNVWGVSSNNAYCITGSNPGYATIDASVSDVSVTATMPNAQDQFLQAIRVNTTTDTGITFAAQGRLLQTFSGSSYTTIGSTSGNLSAGAVIKITAVGSTITVYENGTQIITATSTVNQTATKHGLLNWRGGGAGNATWDSFIVEDAGSGSAVAGGGTLTGTGTLTATGLNNISKGAALTGTGTLTASGTNNISGSASMQGTGTLTASGTVAGLLSGSAALSGTGTLTATGAVAISGGASLTGTGTLAMIQLISGSASLTGVGTLTASGSAGFAHISEVNLYAYQESTVYLQASQELTVNLYASLSTSVSLRGES